MTQATLSSSATAFDALATPPGPTYQEVRDAQRPQNDAARVLGGVAGRIGGAVLEVVSTHKLVHLFADKGAATLARYTGAAVSEKAALSVAATNLLLYAECGIQGTEIAYDLVVKEPARRGAELNQALVRDNTHLGLLFVVNRYAPDAVPPGFLEAEKRRVLGTDTAEFGTVAMGLAGKAAVAVDAENPPGPAAAARDVMLAAFRDGTTTAYQHSIRDQKGLDDALATDKSLRVRYASDPAFHQGLRAAIWQAQNDPKGFHAAALVNAPLRGTPTRM